MKNYTVIKIWKQSQLFGVICFCSRDKKKVEIMIPIKNENVYIPFPK